MWEHSIMLAYSGNKYYYMNQEIRTIRLGLEFTFLDISHIAEKRESFATKKN
jgi:hypothetical protein